MRSVGPSDIGEASWSLVRGTSRSMYLQSISGKVRIDGKVTCLLLSHTFTVFKVDKTRAIVFLLLLTIAYCVFGKVVIRRIDRDLEAIAGDEMLRSG